MAHLRGMGPKPLPAFLGPPVGRIHETRQERPQCLLVVQQRGVCQRLDRPQLGEEVVHIGRGPVPGILSCEVAEATHNRLATADRAEAKVPSQLLVAPPIEHRLEDLVLGVEQRHSQARGERAAGDV